MSAPKRPIAAAVRWLRTTAGELGTIKYRLRELGLADDAIVYRLDTLRKQATRWADRLDGPPFRIVDEDEKTDPIVVPRRGR